MNAMKGIFRKVELQSGYLKFQLSDMSTLTTVSIPTKFTGIDNLMVELGWVTVANIDFSLAKNPLDVQEYVKWAQNPTDIVWYNDDRSNTITAIFETSVYNIEGNYKTVFYLAGGNDLMNSGAAVDHIYGGDGNDTIDAGSGNDFLWGDAGKDNLTGGSGKDNFVFNSKLNSSNNVDTITDFSTADDIIRLENAIFKGLSGTGTLSAAQFVKNTTGLASDASDRIIYESDTGKLFYDADGSGAGSAVHFANLGKNLAVTNADFFII